MNQSEQRPTPETDASSFNVHAEWLGRRKLIESDLVEANFARKLEREREEARTQSNNFAKQLEAMRTAIKEASDALFKFVALGSLELQQRKDAALTQGEQTLAKLQPFLNP